MFFLQISIQNRFALISSWNRVVERITSRSKPANDPNNLATRGFYGFLNAARLQEATTTRRGDGTQRAG